MARVKATQGTRLAKKPEVAIEDAIRRLVKTSIEMNLVSNKEFKKLNLDVATKSMVLQQVADSFGDAVFTLVDCAVVNELSLVDNEDDDEQDQPQNDYDRY